MSIRDFKKCLVVTNLINGTEFKIENIGYIDNKLLMDIINSYTYQWILERTPYKVDYYMDK